MTPRIVRNIANPSLRAQAVQNLGLAVVAIVAGIIVDKRGYLMLEMFFLGWLWSEYLPTKLIPVIGAFSVYYY